MGNYLEGYEQQVVWGAGLSVSAGNKKVVLHTTETGPNSLQALINYWRTNWGAGLPHFIIEGSRVVQLLPLDVGAYTLENAPGGADTNRSGPAVQVEVVSRAQNDWDDETYESVGKWLADLIKAGHVFDIENTPRWYGANEGVILASYNSPIRFGAQAYMDHDGWMAHQHTPENAHWDCGWKDTERIKRIARSHLGTTPVDPSTPSTGDDEQMISDEAKAWFEQEFKNITGRDKIVTGDVFKERVGTTMARDPRTGMVWHFERPGVFRTYVTGPATFNWLAIHGVPYIGDLEPAGVDAFYAYPPNLSDEDIAKVAKFTTEEIEKMLADVVELHKLSVEEQQALAAAVAEQPAT